MFLQSSLAGLLASSLSPSFLLTISALHHISDIPVGKHGAGGVREGREGHKGGNGGNRKRRCVLGTLKPMTLQVHYVLASHRAGPHGMLGPSVGVWKGSCYGFNLDCVVKARVFSSPALLRGGDTFKR